MDKKKKITLDQVEVARQALAALPDLSQDRMSKGQFLSALADRFHTLSQEKGYSLLAIQEALRTIGVRTFTRCLKKRDTHCWPYKKPSEQ
ncbi:hypothetical protein AO282_16445 [Pseudomonas amygdali pv. morsprunorum]|nr:hypothetical protein AO282_16445 [Pseudomonas amygdali pv. morsprunorum]